MSQYSSDSREAEGEFQWKMKPQILCSRPFRNVKCVTISKFDARPSVMNALSIPYSSNVERYWKPECIHQCVLIVNDLNKMHTFPGTDIHISEKDKKSGTFFEIVSLCQRQKSKHWFLSEGRDKSYMLKYSLCWFYESKFFWKNFFLVEGSSSVTHLGSHTAVFKSYSWLCAQRSITSDSALRTILVQGLNQSVGCIESILCLSRTSSNTSKAKDNLSNNCFFSAPVRV